jgi:hypothetical protein
MNPEEMFLNKTTFSEYIEKYVIDNAVSYFDAILHFSEESDKEPEELLQYMSTVLLEKVQQSAIDEGHYRKEVYSIDELL